MIPDTEVWAHPELERIKRATSDLHQRILVLHKHQPATPGEIQNIKAELDSMLDYMMLGDNDPLPEDELLGYKAKIYRLIETGVGLTLEDTDPSITTDMDELKELDMNTWLVMKRAQETEASYTATQRMTETLLEMNELHTDIMQQAALILKEMKLNKGADLASFQRGSFEQVKGQIRTLYPLTELPDDMLENWATFIHKANVESTTAWDEMVVVVNKMPLRGADMLQGAVKVMKTMSREKAQRHLERNDSFIKWMKLTDTTQNLVQQVKNYQLSVEDVLELRDPGIRSPKAARTMGMSARELANIRNPDLMSDDVWENGVVALVRDPHGYSSMFALSHTFGNIGYAGFAYTWEFIIDDLTMYGGEGTAAIALGAADKVLAERGISKEQVIRAAIIYLEQYITSPHGQKAIAQVASPVTGGYQVYRTTKDVYNLIRTREMSAATGVGMSSAIMLLSWINELAWGGELTHRMARVGRGFDSVTDVQQHLQEFMEWANAQFLANKMPEAQMDAIMKQCLQMLDLIDESNASWEAHVDDAIELLRGQVADHRLNKLKKDVHSPLNYRQAAKVWHEGVDSVVPWLRPWRPVTTIIGSHFPKAQLIRGVLYPVLNWGVNGLSKTFPTLAMPAHWLTGGIVSSTGAVTAGAFAYDFIYNDLENTRQALEPMAQVMDKYSSTDYELAEEMSFKPSSWARTLNETLPPWSFSAPNSHWIDLSNAVMNVATFPVDYIMGNDRSSEESAYHFADQYVSRTLLGHKKSYVGTAVKTVLSPVYNAGETYFSTFLDAITNRPTQGLFELSAHTAGGTRVAHEMTKEGEYKWVSSGGKHEYPVRLKTDIPFKPADAPPPKKAKKKKGAPTTF